jgi:restriction endonuclease S subunit
MGDRRRTLTPDALFKCEIPLPPLAEQRRIVARIEQLAGQIAEARSLRQQATDETEAILAAQINTVFSECSLTQKSALYEVAQIGNGQALKKDQRELCGSYTVFGSGGAVGRHTSALTKSCCVVIGRKGSAGQATFAPNGGWIIDTAYFVQPRDTHRLDCKYLYYAILSLDFSKNIISTAIPGINRTAIYSHNITVPDLPAQRRIVAELDALQAEVDKLKALQAETAAELDALLPSILDKAFRGEL